MKIEMCEVTGLTIGWTVLIVAVSLLGGQSCSKIQETENTKIKAGLQQKQVPNASTTTTIWSK